MQRIYFLILVFLISGCTTLPTVDSLQRWHNSEVRLNTITQNILARNLQLCPEHRKNYGLKAIWLTQNDQEAGKIWAETFHLQETPVIITIIPNAAADRAGLHVGDSIVSVNGIPWSASEVDQWDFINELDAAQLSPTMQLGVRRSMSEDTEITFLVTGDDICDAYVVLVDDPGTYAYARGRLVSIEAGLEQLLDDDSELAFVVAHEIAHVIFRSAVPEGEKDLDDKSIRSSVEKEADVMAIQLMTAAGYDPAAAVTAVEKFDSANRGSISRWLGLYGIYMPTEQRVELLKIYAAEVGK